MVFLDRKFNSMPFGRLAFALLCFWICMGSLAAGQDLETLMRSDGAGPWNIAADRISYDEAAKVYIAEGNVVITRLDRRLTADKVRFDHQQMKASAAGHVMLIAGEDVLTAEGIDIDLNSETGTIYGGSIFIQENHFYIQGDTIQKTGKNTYTIDRGSFSACDGKVPAWKITGRNLNVTVEGYGTVQHGALWVKDLPVLYVPYLIFPVKLKRQSGLLTPEFSHSDRKGFEYAQPYYWAISGSSDATFYADVMERRGVKAGIEYRYVLDERSKGALMADGFTDLKTDDGVSADAEDWGYSGDRVSRPNSDRYWFRMKQDQTLPFGFTERMDLDIVSDQDYLQEFRHGYSGFDETENYFTQTFGRDLDDYDDPVRTNRINLLKTGAAYSLNLEGRWYDDVIKRRNDMSDDTLQKLPFAGLALMKQRWTDTPFFWDAEGSYVYFYRQSGNRGHRMDLYPRMYLPYQYKNYFVFEPSVGVHQTSWLVDRWDDEEVDPDTSRALSRTLYDLNMEFTTEISRIYPQGGSDAIRHSIQPKIAYQYLSGFNDDEYPDVDEANVLFEKSRIVYSLTSVWVSRSAQSLSQSDLKVPGDSNGELKTKERLRYDPFLRIKLEQSYDIRESEEFTATDKLDPYWNEPFSPVYGEVRWNAKEFISLQADSKWSVYAGDFLSRNLRMRLRNERLGHLSVEHRYTQYASESIRFDVYANLTDSLALFADYDRNLHDEKDIQQGAGFFYQAQCWSAEFRYSEEEDDRRFDFRIRLFGLGDI